MLCGRRRNFVKRTLISLIRIILVPGCFLALWQAKLISLVTLQICLITSALVFIVLPLLFAYSVTLQRSILFLTFIKYPRNLDLSNPSSVGLYATRSFYVNVEEPEPDKKRIRIGVWHILPEVHANYFEKQLQVKKNTLIEHESKSMTPNRNLDFEKLAMDYPVVKKENEVLFYENLLKLRGTIIIYLHGNTASRGSGHRLETYNMLRLLNYHIISIDYRGYGDSDPIAPTEEGVVRDALAVYEYITNLTSSPIFIWGHSLGTGVATHLCAQLNKLHIRGPRGLILESPFTNIRDEIKLHPLARPFKNLPWFDKTFSQPMYRNRLRFESDKHIASFPQPVMIIHAEDDYVVPFHLGYKLYRHALEIRNKSWGPIEFHRFDGIHKYGHKYLCRAPELPRLVETFVNSYRDVMF